MSLTVTLYTKPACVQCEQTKRLMTKEGIPFTPVQVEPGSEESRYLTEDLNYFGVPVVVWEAGGVVGGHWHGFRPDRIRELKVYMEPATDQHVLVSGSTA